MNERDLTAGKRTFESDYQANECEVSEHSVYPDRSVQLPVKGVIQDQFTDPSTRSNDFA